MAFHRAIVELADSARLNAVFAQWLVELRRAFGLRENAESLHAPRVPMNRCILQRFEAARFAEAAGLLADDLVQSERGVLAAYARRIGSAAAPG